MADFTKKIILIVLYWISEIKLIPSSPYCEFGLCKEDQICCNTNECCAKPNLNQTFYVLGWVLAGVLIAVLTCCGIFRNNKIITLIFTQSSDKIPLTKSPTV